MSTEPNAPDPKAVREIAERAIRCGARQGVTQRIERELIQPQDERDARIAMLEREVRDLRGTELNPSPMVLDAQAYGELRDEIAATMGDEWDLDEAEISILIKYVRWLGAGQPRDEDGYPVRRETYPPAAAEQDERDGDVRAVAMRAFLDLHAERRGHDLIASLAVGDGRTLELTRSGLNRLLDENKRLRELATRTTDGLVLAPKDQCAALLAYDRTVIRCERIGDHWPALHTVRFGDGARVEWRDPEPSIEVDAALEARDAKAGERR